MYFLVKITFISHTIFITKTQSLKKILFKIKRLISDIFFHFWNYLKEFWLTHGPQNSFYFASFNEDECRTTNCSLKVKFESKFYHLDNLVLLALSLGQIEICKVIMETYYWTIVINCPDKFNKLWSSDTFLWVIEKTFVFIQFPFKFHQIMRYFLHFHATMCCKEAILLTKHRSFFCSS